MPTADSSLSERLKQLEADLEYTPPRFVKVSSLPFAIFHYPPQDEWALRRELNSLASRLRNRDRDVYFLSLGQLLWQAIGRCEGLDALVDLEKWDGFDAVQDQVFAYLTEEEWAPLPVLVSEAIHELGATHPRRDVVFLYRAGAFAPNMYSMSRLVNELQGRVQTPIVLFYPGGREGTFGLRYMDLRDRAAMGNYRVQIY